MRRLTILMLVVVLPACGRPQQKAPSNTNAGTITDFANVGVYEDFKSRGFYLVHLPDNKLVALDTASTHLGCITNWLPKERMFENPCQGSLYDVNGINRTGPDPRPLERCRIYVHAGQVVVDTSVRFRSELGEWDAAGSFIELPAPDQGGDPKAGAAKGRPSAVAGLKCEVRSTRGKLPFNERPRFQATLTNVSSEPIDLIATAEWAGGLPGPHIPCAFVKISLSDGGYFMPSENSARQNPKAVRIEPGKSWSFTYPSTPDRQTYGDGAMPSLSALLPGTYTAEFGYAVRDVEKERLGEQLVYGPTAGELAGKRPTKLWEGVVYAEPVTFEVVDDGSSQLKILRDVYAGKGLDNLRMELLKPDDQARPDAQALRLRLHNAGERTIYLGSDFGLVYTDPAGEKHADFGGLRNGSAIELKPSSQVEIGGWSFDFVRRKQGKHTVWVEYHSMGTNAMLLVKSEAVAVTVTRPPATTQSVTPPDDHLNTGVVP